MPEAPFGLPKGTTATLAFKGGTSRSKAFGAIRRSSAGVDLSFDRAKLCHTGDRDPEKKEISKKQLASPIDELAGDVTRHICEKLVPALRAAIGEPANSEGRLRSTLATRRHSTSTTLRRCPKPNMRAWFTLRGARTSN